MRVPVLTAVGDAGWETALLGELDGADHGLTVVRRCVDLPDLLAAAATGQARAVVVSATLRRLDSDALARLALSRVAVVGLVEPGDESAERRLRQLGVTHVLPSDSPVADIGAAVVAGVAAVEALGRPGTATRASYGDAGLAVPDGPGQVARSADPTGEPPSSTGAAPLVGDPSRSVPLLGEGGWRDRGRPGGAHGPAGPGDPGVAVEGQVVAVWGPTGAPGRTTVAVGIATELAELGRSALLVDADPYGGVVAQVLGLLDEAPGLAAACRLATSGALDATALAGVARSVGDHLRVLTGIARADRWPELRPTSVEAVLRQARLLAATTVVDCGFCLEQDEELSYDTAAPRRNGSTVAVLADADVVVVVGSADPVGLQRLVRGLADLRELAPDLEPVVVVNRLRASAVPGDAESEVRGALERYAGTEVRHVVPLDVPGVDAALAAGRSLAERSPQSPVRRALAALAADLVGAPAPSSGRRGSRGSRRRATPRA